MIELLPTREEYETKVELPTYEEFKYLLSEIDASRWNLDHDVYTRGLLNRTLTKLSE